MIDGMRVKPFKIPAGPEFQMRAGNVKGPDSRKEQPFSEILASGVKRINELQVNADNMTNRLALGEVEDISEVSIAVEKAELALRLMVQIRDKLVDAYQQIARMGV
jgi:flagellar hook-basal body complex protein FliE